MHTSATTSKSVTVLGFFIAISSTVLDMRDVVSGIAETLDIITETLIMLLLDGLGGRWTLIGALEIPDEHGTHLVPGVNGSFG
jgi:hypothetical protein